MSILSALRHRAELLTYVPLAVTTTAAAVARRDRAHLVSKMLLAPTLAGGVIATRGERSASRTVTLAVALTGSGVGDWFMNRSERAEHDSDLRRLQMRRGAVAFAVQQSGFLLVLLSDGVRPRALPTVFTAAVMSGIGALDLSTSGGPDPVLSGYALLLGSMAALSIGDGGSPRNRRIAALGGGLFLLSDATIIIGEHLSTTPARKAVVSGIVLSTYTAALALLVHGLRDEPVVEVAA